LKCDAPLEHDSLGLVFSFSQYARCIKKNDSEEKEYYKLELFDLFDNYVNRIEFLYFFVCKKAFLTSRVRYFLWTRDCSKTVHREHFLGKVHAPYINTPSARTKTVMDYERHIVIVAVSS